MHATVVVTKFSTDNIQDPFFSLNANKKEKKKKKEEVEEDDGDNAEQGSIAGADA